MKMIKLKCGDIIVVHMAHKQNDNVIGVHGRNLSSPYLRVKSYNNDSIDDNAEVSLDEAKTLLTQRMESNFYQGELKSSKNSEPHQTKAAFNNFTQ